MLYTIAHFDSAVPVPPSASTVQVLQHLCKQLRIPYLITSPSSSPLEEQPPQPPTLKRSNNRRNNRAQEIFSDEAWEQIRVTPVPPPVAVPTALSKSDEIRALLNKLTDDTYLHILHQITTRIQEWTTATTEDLAKISELIFDIASSNRFFANLYANLYCHLLENIPTLKDVYQSHLTTFHCTFEVWESADPNKNYDEYCRINRNNERRRSLSLFFVNLMKHKMIEENIMVDIVGELLHKIYTWIEQENKHNEVNECAEIIAILLQPAWLQQPDVRLKCFDNKSIADVVRPLAQLKPKDFPSYPNKARFQFMDYFTL